MDNIVFIQQVLREALLQPPLLVPAIDHAHAKSAQVPLISAAP